MKLKRVFLGLVLIEVATKHLVKGLQCYVCEDCNEYEDFKELHICGEIPVELTVQPTVSSITQPASVAVVTTSKPVSRTSVAASTKPNEHTTIDDYLYEDSDERHDAQNVNKKKVTNRVTTSTLKSTTVELKSTSSEEISAQKPTALTEKFTTTTATLSPVTNTGAALIQQASAKETTGSTTSTIATTTTNRFGGLMDYDDYLDYEEPLKMTQSAAKFLLRISEPVCYMIKYHANNTVITNRGCTNFINANKYLTCQSLQNGAVLETCRVCSSNGCNKFLDNDGYEDSYDNYLNAAAGFQHFGFFILLLWVSFSRVICLVS